MMALQENQDLEREPEITEQAANSDNGRSDRLSGLSLLSVISWGAVISGFFLIAVAVGFNLSNTITLLGLCLSVIGTGFIAWQSADAFKQRHDEAKEMADAHRRLGSTLKALNIAHQSVAESEGRYRSLVESQTELILRRDTDGEVTFVNDTFLKAMDRSREDLLYQPFNIDGPDGESDFTTTVLNPLAAPPHRRTREVELSTALGARWYQVEDSAVLDGDGTINEIQTVLYDITEAKQHQAMLTDVKAQADRANIEKTGLIAALSQEIRTPMNGILGMSELLLDTDIDDEQKTYVQAVRESGEGLLEIVDDLLEFARAEAGQADFRRQSFSLDALVDRMVAQVFDRARQKDIVLTSYIARDVPRQFISDPERIKRVLYNLVTNAIRYTATGGISLQISCISRGADQSRLRFAVIDTGSGIDFAKQSSLFEHFTQFSSPAKDIQKGPGLGLAISKQIVETMGGDIGVESQKGKGSTFWFEMPLDHQSSLTSVPHFALDTTHILVAHQNRVLLDHFKMLLEEEGARVTTVSSARQVLHEFSRADDAGDPFDLVISGLTLPDASAKTVLAQIQHDSTGTPPQTMVLLDADQRAMIERLKRDGFDHCQLLPVKREDLMNAILQLKGLSVPVQLPESKHQTQLQTALSAIDANDDLSILLVEDNFVNQMLAVTLLEKLGAKVKKAENGSEALDAVRQDHFDLIFMDIQMPDMDGLAATRLIRKLNNDASTTPIIAMTANSLAEHREDCFAAGMDDYLAKPINLDDLRRAISDWEGRRSGKAISKAVA